MNATKLQKRYREDSSSPDPEEAGSNRTLEANREFRKQKTRLPPSLPVDIRAAPMLDHTAINNERLPSVKEEDLWQIYQPFRSLRRGAEVTAARHKLSSKMVVVREITQKDIEDVRHLKHINIVNALELYSFNNERQAVLEYTITSLDRIIALPVPLEEHHVAYICSQLFEGMKYLSKVGLAVQNLTLSNVLVGEDECFKIATIGNCMKNPEMPRARPLGVIAIAMITKGAAPLEEDKLVLPKSDWSHSAKNFIDVTDWAPLELLRNHKFLASLDPKHIKHLIQAALWQSELN